MKLAINHFPSHIAKILACDVGLLSDMETDWVQLSNVELCAEIDRLIQFQQMSIVASFEDCLVAYYGIDLSGIQLENLKIIYEVTPKLFPAILFDGAMEAIANERRNKEPNMAAVANSFHTVINMLTNSKKVA
jgi:hypothetical protein